MEHEKPKLPAWIPMLMAVVVLMIFGCGGLAMVGLFTFRSMEVQSMPTPAARPMPLMPPAQPMPVVVPETTVEPEVSPPQNPPSQ